MSDPVYQSFKDDLELLENAKASEIDGNPNYWFFSLLLFIAKVLLYMAAGRRSW